MPAVADHWIEQPCCGGPVCTRMTMEQKSRVSGASGSKPTERGPMAVCLSGPQPLRVITTGHQAWTQAPSMAPHGYWTAFWPTYYMYLHFEHCQDNLGHICEILGCLMGQAQVWAAPDLDRHLGALCLTIMSSLARILRKLVKT